MRGSFVKSRGLVWGVACALLTSASSCAPSLEDEPSVIAQCELPPDQAGTLSGRWRSYPIYVSFKEGQFNAYELDLMMDAADRWNKYYNAAHGFQILDYGNRGHPRTTTREKPLNLCGTNMVSSDGAQSTSVTIYKNSSWPTTTGYSTSTIALTSFCTNSATPVNAMKSAMMELNFQHFFAAGKPVPDLTSILVHEFGHLIGLDHSCDVSGVPGVRPPKCSSPSIDASYFDAVMYPTVGFDAQGEGVVKRSLNTNDQGRASCLYGSSAI
jgi:hypothetical protein